MIPDFGISELQTPRLFWNVQQPADPSEKLTVRGIFGSLISEAQPDRRVDVIATRHADFNMLINILLVGFCHFQRPGSPGARGVHNREKGISPEWR